MANRTTPGAVQDVLGTDWDQQRPLTAFVAAANRVTTRLVTAAATDGVTIGATDAELIERWVAAYLYTLSDRLYTSRSTRGKSGSFFFAKQENPYLTAAKALDPSGLLGGVLDGQTADVTWVGTTEPDQRTFEDRN